jgi:hypothetical protein
VIAFFIGESEEPFLEKGIPFVPNGDSHAEVLKAVAESGQSVFIPAIGAAARLIVRKVIPGVSIRTIVFPHSAPGTLGQVGPPFLPIRRPSRAVA